MANKMLIDASHPEETRVVVLRGNRVEEFDFESTNKKQLRGNIYLAKVTRVEPSLQAAFVDYGGNRHGFLAFSEIHPDYYQIPVVDRQALIEEESRAQHEDEEEPVTPRRSRRYRRGDRNGNGNGQRGIEKRRHDAEDEIIAQSAPIGEESEEQLEEGMQEALQKVPLLLAPPAEADSSLERDEDLREREEAQSASSDNEEEASEALTSFSQESGPAHGSFEDASRAHGSLTQEAAFSFTTAGEAEAHLEEDASEEDERQEATAEEDNDESAETSAAFSASEAPAARHQFDDAFPDEEGDDNGEDEDGDENEEDEQVEQLGGDSDTLEEALHHTPRYRRQYKIQEVIKRRQILLVQVVKEERGNKGAALTTYLSLAGRYSVLMPNTARGGGISRKITDAGDRQRLKAIAQELEVPEGMGVILRTAGASRTKAEVKRDFEYLLRMWETVREMTLQSTAPTLVYEEGSLIKRAIRDLYNKDIDEIIVSGEAGYREAKDFMRMLMPSHAKSVQLYRDPQPIFAKSGVEAQLDAMFSNQVTLRSGGYLVINQTEALVAIDVNSGRSTREHNIEDTAVRTNLEAADEIARQLRLRDLAGLIVIDFIDMEEGRNNRAVERRLKEALKNDRARIQVGRISHFGLLEMSRQRIRTGVFEGSTVVCQHCLGAGMVRSTSSIALHVLRLLEDALIKNSAYDIIVKTRTTIALYILNQKRTNLRELEQRFGVTITVAADESLTGMTYHALERGELATGTRLPAPREGVVGPADFFPLEEEETEPAAEAYEQEVLDNGEDVGEEEEAASAGGSENETEAEGRRRRRRKRRRGGRGTDREGSGISANAPQPSDDALGLIAGVSGYAAEQADLTLLPFERGHEDRAETAPMAEVEVPAEGNGQEAATEAASEASGEMQGEEAATAPSRRPRRSRSRGPRRPAAEALEAAETETPLPPSDQESSSPLSPQEIATPELADHQILAPAVPVTAEARGHEEEKAETSSSLPQETKPSEELVSDQAPEAEKSEKTPVVSLSESQSAAPVQTDMEEKPELAPENTPPQPKRSGWWQRAKASLRG